VDMFYDDQGRVAVTGPRVARPKSDAGINGMQIVLSNGKEKCLKSPHRGFHRPMVVCEGMHFVGLTGEIAPVSIFLLELPPLSLASLYLFD
jgi:hypothetical protein